MTDAVRYELPDPAYAAYSWVYDNEHSPGSQPPLTRGMFGGMSASGSPDEPPRQLFVNGYSYSRVDPEGGPPFPGPSADDATSPWQRWEQKWRPRVDALVEELRAFDPASVATGEWAATLGEQEKQFGRIFVGVHGQAVIPSDQAASVFVDGYAAHFGQSRRGDALALLQGFPNRTLDRAIALWALGREVRAQPALGEALSQGPAALQGVGVGAGFADRFQAFLEEFGQTPDMFVQDHPTWAEDPAAPLAMIRSYAHHGETASPAAATARQAARRQALEDELRTAAADDSAAGAVLALLPAAQEVMPVKEDHNFICDQRLTAASRARWLAIGAHLAAQGAPMQADDVFYYERTELLKALEGGARLDAATLAERRTRQTAYRAAPPPLVLGKPLPDEPPQASAMAGTQRTVSLPGVGASGGVYGGRARQIRNLRDAATLVAGDVLICGVTAPAWTPYFSIVGAVVTDAGGALSHPAIVAREYGIPAVVGTRTATRVIPDGATVTVDGDAGVVVIESP